MGFWEWSNDAYVRPGVEAALLRLQDDHGLDINLLLWCLWCAVRFEEPPQIAIRKAVDLTRGWAVEIVAPIRAARRALKSPPTQAPPDEVAALREGLRKKELLAERIEQKMLAAHAEACLAPVASADGVIARARRNLASYVRMTDAAKGAGFSVSLLEDLIALTFSAPESGGVSR